jgi:hypothetical protein
MQVKLQTNAPDLVDRNQVNQDEVGRAKCDAASAAVYLPASRIKSGVISGMEFNNGDKLDNLTGKDCQLADSGEDLPVKITIR